MIHHHHILFPLRENRAFQMITLSYFRILPLYKLNILKLLDAPENRRLNIKSFLIYTVLGVFVVIP